MQSNSKTPKLLENEWKLHDFWGLFLTLIVSIKEAAKYYDIFVSLSGVHILSVKYKRPIKNTHSPFFDQWTVLLSVSVNKATVNEISVSNPPGDKV